MTDERLSLHQKVGRFVQVLTAQDWTPDGYNKTQDYYFVSHKKMKKNVSKAATETGLVWSIDYDDLTVRDPIGSMKQHYTVRATARLTDADDGSQYVEYHGYGEAGDSGDKALAKAQTSGFKAIINNNFFVADIDNETESIIENQDSIKAEAKSGYEANQNIVRERVTRKMDSSSITPTQRGVMDKILNRAKVLSDADLMQFGSLIQIENDYHNAKSPDDAQAFISAYTGVLRCQ